MAEHDPMPEGEPGSLLDELFPPGATTTVHLGSLRSDRSFPLTARVTLGGMCWGGGPERPAVFRLDLEVDRLGSEDAYEVLSQLGRLPAARLGKDGAEATVWLRRPDASDGEASLWKLADGLHLRQGAGCKFSFVVADGGPRIFDFRPSETRVVAEALASGWHIKRVLEQRAAEDERALRAALAPAVRP